MLSRTFQVPTRTRAAHAVVLTHSVAFIELANGCAADALRAIS